MEKPQECIHNWPMSEWPDGHTIASAALETARISALADYLEDRRREPVRLYWQLVEIVARPYDDEHTQAIELWQTVRDQKARELAQSGYGGRLGSSVYAFLDCVARLWGEVMPDDEALRTLMSAMINLGNAEVWYNASQS